MFENIRVIGTHGKKAWMFGRQSESGLELWSAIALSYIEFSVIQFLARSHKTFQTKHSEYTQKDVKFFQRHEASLKCQKLDTRLFSATDHNSGASFTWMALSSAKQKKPYTFGETIPKPCMLKS